MIKMACVLILLATILQAPIFAVDCSVYTKVHGIKFCTSEADTIQDTDFVDFYINFPEPRFDLKDFSRDAGSAEAQAQLFVDSISRYLKSLEPEIKALIGKYVLYQVPYDQISPMRLDTSNTKITYTIHAAATLQTMLLLSKEDIVYSIEGYDDVGPYEREGLHIKRALLSRNNLISLQCNGKQINVYSSFKRSDLRKISVYNMSGQTVTEINFTGNNTGTDFNLKLLPSVYFVALTAVDGNRSTSTINVQ